jgi:hypothetical protein
MSRAKTIFSRAIVSVALIYATGLNENYLV